MINKVALVAIAVLCITTYGTVKPKYFTGYYETPSGGVSQSTLPSGIMSGDISPDKIRFEHLRSILNVYETNLRQGTLKAALAASATMDTLYLFSFVVDKRFSSLIYDQYSKRLFDEFGGKEASAVLLYYRTGGNLEKLRALYQQPINDEVRLAIEACFFDASVGLMERQENIDIGMVAQPLSVKLSPEIHPVLNCWSDEKARTERDLYVKYENTTKNLLIKIEIPRQKHRNCWSGFSMTRKDGVPVLPYFGKKHGHKKQFITLYPGDSYIRKVDLDFLVKDPGHIVAQLFSDFGKKGVVLGNCWVGNSEDDFRFFLRFECNFLAAESNEALNDIVDGVWKKARSAPLELSYGK